MDTTRIERFAKFARKELLRQIAIRLDTVTRIDSLERRENSKAVEELERKLDEFGKDQLIERTAYTWFNRFCALRFMEVCGYLSVRVVSPVVGGFQPEILAEAKQGHIDETVVPETVRKKVGDLLSGKMSSNNPDAEAYRLLIKAACNHWNTALPFLFEKIDDYTELLMPDDLLSGTSILAYTREAMLPEVCENVEVIGWLYQFYIADKKEEVFQGLKKSKKITPANIPAATQLFTPNWIVRYLVENSLGRLWMLNRPNSELIGEMPYYIKPENSETEFLKISSPEEIKLCDPACGSGHMLVYAFDLLYAMYEEEGYDPATIPTHILTKNLYGIEIDERAGALASFALTMKAREKQPGFFKKSVEPNIFVLKKIEFDQTETKSDIWKNLFHIADDRKGRLEHDLKLFGEADNFGSLLRPKLTAMESDDLFAALPQTTEKLLEHNTLEKCRFALRQSNVLASQYHVVVANPPYMGGRGMNARLAEWARKHFPDTKSDLFAMFIERNGELVVKNGTTGMITMQSWMFLSSFENLRASILNRKTILTMAHFGPRAFDSIGGEVVSTTGFVLRNSHHPDFKGDYLRLVNGNSETEKREAILEAINNPHCGWFYRASAADFKKIPGEPVAYWFTPNILKVFENSESLGKIASPRQGLATADNDRFVRLWHEVELTSICFYAQTMSESIQSRKKWFPYNKGGDYRKWYGNQEHIVNWMNDGNEIRNFFNKNGKLCSRPQNTNFYFKEALSWSKVTSGGFSLRHFPQGFVFDVAGCSIFFENDHARKLILGVMNSPIMKEVLGSLSPTLNFEVGQVAVFPVQKRLQNFDKSRIDAIDRIVDKAKTDWDAYETSWDFTFLPLLRQEYRCENMAATYTSLRASWQAATDEMKRLEEENNRIFIDAYGLQDELEPDVPLKEITLTCNPHYRYGGDKTNEELENLLRADTMRELLSYAVGCMFGRYSPDAPGLILANQGETLDDYLKRISNPSFQPSETNVIPILDDDWFSDDVTERFKVFLRTAFGNEKYEENLRFIESALDKSVRDYFVRDFYNDHVKRYKKRPIYWLFSSPKGAFTALIYQHRYRPDTVNIVLNNYLREYIVKLNQRIEEQQWIEAKADAPQRDKSKAGKEIVRLRKILKELTDWERDVLYPLGVRKIVIDLDDGVKVNYTKFGSALKKIPGLEQTEE